MTVRDSLARLFGAQLKASVIGLEDGQLPDSPLEKAFDDAALLSTYGDDPWPYLCATKLAENAALAPLQFGTLDSTGEWEWVGADHPVQSLWDRPNELEDGASLLFLLWIYLEMVGHSPIEIVRPKAGYGHIAASNRDGFELNLIHPGKWRIVANADATVKGYVYLGGTTDYRWSSKEMTYLRWPNPNNRWYGQGRLQAVRTEIMAEEYASLRDKGLEKRLGVPPGILTSEMPLGEPTALELQRRWEKAVGGYRNSGKIGVLGSKTTYQAIAQNARDSQWQPQRQARQDAICMAFGIPPVLMRMSDATFANAGEARAELWEGNLQPRGSRVAAMVTRRVVPMLTNEPLVARFDYSGVKALNENEQEIVTIAANMANTASVTVGEVRARLNLEPFGDERDDAILMPTTLEWSTDRAAAAQQAADLATRLAEQRQTQADQATGTPAGASGRSGADTMPADGQNMQDGQQGPSKAAAHPVVTKARRRDREQLLAPVRAGFAADLHAFFRAQRGALRPITKALPNDKDLIARAIEILSAIRWRQRLERVGRPPIETSLTLGASEAAAALGIDATFLVEASDAALAAVLRRAVNLPNVVNGTTIADVERELRAALAAAEDHAAMNARLDTLFSGYEEWRIDRIARTETAYAYAGGASGQMRDAGVAMVLISDGDGDEGCAAANGQEWTIDQYEANPLEHPNCTRDYEPIFMDEVL